MDKADRLYTLNEIIGDSGIAFVYSHKGQEPRNEVRPIISLDTIVIKNIL